MLLKNEKILCSILFLIMLSMGLWGHFNLPDAPMAVHFGFDGQPNGFQPRDTALWLMPAVTLLTLILCLWVLPVVMPKKASIERSQIAYGATMLAVTALLTATHAMIILIAAGVVMDVPRITQAGVGLLLVIIGNYLPKTRRNRLMGVRNVWTLSDERVWDKTHRFAGPLFMLAGVAVVGAAFIMPSGWNLGVLLAAVLVLVVLSYGYSYIVAKSLR